MKDIMLPAKAEIISYKINVLLGIIRVIEDIWRGITFSPPLVCIFSFPLGDHKALDWCTDGDYVVTWSKVDDPQLFFLFIAIQIFFTDVKLEISVIFSNLEPGRFNSDFIRKLDKYSII